MKIPRIRTILKWVATLTLVLVVGLALMVWNMMPTPSVDRQLVRAARDGDIAWVKRLLEKGADVGRAHRAIPLASQNGHLEIVRLLLDHVSDINHHLSNWPARHALAGAAWAGQTAIVELLIEKGAQVDATYGSGLTALMEASARGRLEMVRLLLSKGANVNAQTAYGATPLKKAAEYGNAEVVRLLLDKGADLNAKLKDGSTALMWAAIAGHIDVVKLLLDKGADVHAKAEDGSTALMWAAVTGHSDLVTLLKGHGAELTLPTAAMIGDLAEVQRLVGSGADVNEQDSGGWTPLMYAAQKGRLEVAELLLEKGADPNTKRKDGSTAFMDAIGSAQVDTIQLLLDKGADARAERRIPRGKTDFVRMTPLAHAAMYDQPEIVKLIKTHATGE
jgi:ankyrin repeat protein